MAQVVENSAPSGTKSSSAEKRKLEATSSDDELFFAYESNTKLQKSEPTKPEEVKGEGETKTKSEEAVDKENKIPFATKPAVAKTTKAEETVSTPKANVAQKLISPKPTALDSPKTNKFMIQQKLSFSPAAAAAAAKSSNATPEKASVPAPKPVKRPNGEWFIEDYLVDEQWKRWLSDEFEKPYFKEINRVVKEGYEKNIVRPPKELVFNALNSTKLDKIKVVIIGQDPYHDDGQAHGLAFSVPKGIALPPSLRNIFTELKNDLPGFKRNESLGGCLQKWANEGVFMLNTFLTVEAHKAGSHSKIGWDQFTDRVIKLISEKNSGCAFLLWGNFAQKKESLIDKKKHSVIKSAHPSPFSVTRFFGSKPFSQANAYLKSIGKTPVNWNLE